LSIGAALLLLLALVLGLWTATRPGRLHVHAAAFAANQLVRIMPRVILALLTAGFLGKLVPAEVVGSMIGPETGARGILLASLVGGFTPGGPIISFPIMVVLREAGAGLPQLVAFLTAWSVFAVHRVLIYETTMLGWKFSATRLFASLLLPPTAGFLTELLAWAFGITNW
jgi:uncharacterized membrane protein YraQ (UPF0718 family)